MDRKSKSTPITRRDFMKTTIAGVAGAAIAFGKINRTTGGPVMQKEMFELPKLPYPDSALEPHISARTISFHYGKHHQGYVTKSNKFVQGTEYAGMPIEDIIAKTASKPELASIFNNVAQVFNHTFFWNSMKPDGGGKPTDEVAQKIDEAFGSYEKFAEEFAAAAAGQFGSGWAWLAADKGKLVVVKTSNADNPLTQGMKPILTLDVWEHAYYLDYQNRRPDFVKAYLENLVNWDFVGKNLK